MNSLKKNRLLDESDLWEGFMAKVFEALDAKQIDNVDDSLYENAP